LQTNVRMSQSVFIDPVKKELRTVFISSKNTSGQPINLEQSLSNELQAKGYKIVDDPDEATYILMVNVLYCDKKQENN
ncbi:complement resistance protein TraT, partial [Aliarcobacter butzleri]